MTPIEKLKEITGAEAGALKNAGVETITSLWERIGADPDHGLDLLAGTSGIPYDRLVALLAAQGSSEVRQRLGSWLRRSWLGAAILIGLLVIIGLAIYASTSSNALTWLSGLAGPLTQQVVSASSQGLPAYHLIALQDVKLADLPLASGSFKTPEEVVGRFTLQEIPAKQPIMSSLLSDIQAGTGDLHVLSVPVAAHNLELAAPGRPASLLLAPREGSTQPAPPGRLVSVTVLAIHHTGEQASLVVAVSQADLGLLNQYLGLADVFVVAGK